MTDLTERPVPSPALKTLFLETLERHSDIQLTEPWATASLLRRLLISVGQMLDVVPSDNDPYSRYLCLGRAAYRSLNMDQDFVALFLPTTLDSQKTGIMGVYRGIRILSDTNWCDFDSILPTNQMFFIQALSGGSIECQARVVFNLKPA